MRPHLLASLLLVSSLAIVGSAGAHDWNDAGIGWKTYTDGLVAAPKEKKPICLVIFTEWCPHCKNYSAVFKDAKVVEQAKQFVMIHVDKDKEPEVSKKYAPDGEYIPRTYFLSSEGTLDPALQAPRAEDKYFYNEGDPAQLLASMDAALKKLH